MSACQNSRSQTPKRETVPYVNCSLIDKNKVQCRLALPEDGEVGEVPSPFSQSVIFVGPNRHAFNE